MADGGAQVEHVATVGASPLARGQGSVEHLKSKMQNYALGAHPLAPSRGDVRRSSTLDLFGIVRLLADKIRLLISKLGGVLCGSQ